MPANRPINYARATGQRVTYDAQGGVGTAAVNYVVGRCVGLVYTDYNNAGFLSSAVIGFSGSACVSGVFLEIGALIASQEGLDPAQGDQILL